MADRKVWVISLKSLYFQKSVISLCIRGVIFKHQHLELFWSNVFLCWISGKGSVDIGFFSISWYADCEFASGIHRLSEREVQTCYGISVLLGLLLPVPGNFFPWLEDSLWIFHESW